MSDKPFATFRFNNIAWMHWLKTSAVFSFQELFYYFRFFVIQQLTILAIWIEIFLYFERTLYYIQMRPISPDACCNELIHGTILFCADATNFRWTSWFENIFSAHLSRLKEFIALVHNESTESNHCSWWYT